MDAAIFIKAINPLLKAEGFKKAGSTWRREQDESIAVFNVQKSQWGDRLYYINIGTYFRKFGTETAPTENKCHVRTRLDISEPSNVFTEAMEWFQARASIQNASLLAEEDSKRGLVAKELHNVAAT